MNELSQWLRAGEQVGAHYIETELQRIPKSLLNEAADVIDKLEAEVKDLYEQVAFLESKEVCTLPHNDFIIDGCPYCRFERVQIALQAFYEAGRKQEHWKEYADEAHRLMELAADDD